MVAASRSGSTSAVMRLSSPIASTLASHSSMSLELGLARVWPGSSSSDGAGFSDATDTLMSMDDFLPAERALSIIVRRAGLIDREFPIGGGPRLCEHRRVKEDCADVSESDRGRPDR